MGMVTFQLAKKVATRLVNGLLAAVHNHIHGIQNLVNLYLVFIRAYNIGKETRNSSYACQKVRRRIRPPIGTQVGCLDKAMM
jgi:hypothetical protein